MIRSLVLAFLLSIGSSQAAIFIATSGSGAAGNASMTFPQINFTFTSNFGGGTMVLIIDNAHAFDTGDTFTFSVTGPSLGGGALAGWREGGFSGGSVGEVDSYFWTFGASAFTSGSSLLFGPGTVSMTSANASFDLFSSGSYEVFLTTDFGVRLSSNAVLAIIPEPSRASLALLAIAGTGLRRKRR
jgi:hypothetical protein